MNNKFKSYFVVGGFIVAILVGFFIVPVSNNNLSDEVQISEVGTQNETELQVDSIYVYVLGAVKEPGVIETSENSRLYEVIELAGGITDDADVQKINLASVVKDEEKIIVPYFLSR